MHIGHAVFFANSAIEGLVLGVRVDVDQTRHNQPVLAVDYPVSRSRPISSDVSDLVIGEYDVNAAAIDMTFRRLVPGNDPIGVPDEGCCPRGSPPLHGYQLR